MLSFGHVLINQALLYMCVCVYYNCDIGYFNKCVLIRISMRSDPGVVCVTRDYLCVPVSVYL